MHENCRMSRQVFPAIAGFALAMQALATLAQAPIPASVCELAKSPVKYANQVVEVRGKVSLGFENFTLRDSDCAEKDRSVWLAYGGDEPTPTTSTVNDQARPAGSVVKVNGRAVLLQRDESLELFKRRLAALRIGVKDDLNCYDECRFYEVTATFTGVFFAAADKRPGGYGHMGCCHLLAIQRVSEVDARRTEVPAGGRFACTTETWDIAAAEAQSMEERRHSCHGFDDCRKAAGEELIAVARHWNDPTNLTGEGDLSFFTGPHWHSADRLKAYSIAFQHQPAEHAAKVISGGIGTRVQCKAVSPPLPFSTPIGCKGLWSELPVSQSAAKVIQERVKLGQDSWRMGSADVAAKGALDEAVRLWGVTPAPGLKLGDCGKPMVVDGDQFSWCNWVDPDGMQQLMVQVTRLGALRHWKSWESVPWVLTRGDGIVCTTE